MNLRAVFFLCVTFVLGVGCKSQQSSQHLDEFIFSTVQSYGGRKESKTTLPTLKGAWTRTEDKNGIVIQSQKIKFQEVDQILRIAYGDPTEGGKTPDGHVQWVIPARIAGVAIWYSQIGDGVQITINRPLNQWRTP